MKYVCKEVDKKYEDLLANSSYKPAESVQTSKDTISGEIAIKSMSHFNGIVDDHYQLLQDTIDK